MSLFFSPTYMCTASMWRSMTHHTTPLRHSLDVPSWLLLFEGVHCIWGITTPQSHPPKPDKEGMHAKCKIKDSNNYSFFTTAFNRLNWCQKFQSLYNNILAIVRNFWWCIIWLQFNVVTNIRNFWPNKKSEISDKNINAQDLKYHTDIWLLPKLLINVATDDYFQ